MEEKKTCFECGTLIEAGDPYTYSVPNTYCEKCSLETFYPGYEGGSNSITASSSDSINAGQVAGIALFTLVYVGFGILGLVIHVWTIVIAYAASGLFAALIALCLPVLAQVYWFFQVMSASETIANSYCLSILIYLALLVVMFFGVTAVVARAESK